MNSKHIKIYKILSCFVDISLSLNWLLNLNGEWRTALPEYKALVHFECGILLHFGADFARLLQNYAASNQGRDLSKLFAMVKFIYHFMRKF